MSSGSLQGGFCSQKGWPTLHHENGEIEPRNLEYNLEFRDFVQTPQCFLFFYASVFGSTLALYHCLPPTSPLYHTISQCHPEQ